MKRYLVYLYLVCVACAAFAQSADPVLMRVNGKDVLRSEFEYNYNKNNGESAVEATSVEQYVPMFVNYKLKIEAARDARYDTLTSYKNEYRMYRDQLIRPMLVSDDDVEAQVLNYYNLMKQEIGEKGLCHAAHIIIAASQNASPAELATAKAKIDSIYAEVQGGADFSELARLHSQDGAARNGGDLGWFAHAQLVKEFSDVAFAMEDSAVSTPIQTAFGWHIIKKFGHKQLESYDELRDKIKAFLERQKVRDRISNVVADSISKQRGVTLDELMDAECDRICAQDADTRYLVQEYREGLLLFEICDREIWKPALADEAGQQKFFKSHKKNYTWKEPRFAGVVLQAKDEAAMKDAEAVLAKCKDRNKWVDELKNKVNADSTRVRVEYKLFAKGDNRWVDHQFFGAEKPTHANRLYPLVKCVGKLLPKKAEKWYDVSVQLQEDYRRYCEDKWVEQLRRCYTVWVDDSVLQTVNKH